MHVHVRLHILKLSQILNFLQLWRLITSLLFTLMLPKPQNPKTPKPQERLVATNNIYIKICGKMISNMIGRLSVRTYSSATLKGASKAKQVLGRAARDENIKRQVKRAQETT